LVVEKHRAACVGVVYLLEQHPDIEVVGAVKGDVSGRELLELANERQVDVVILDFSVAPLGAEAFEVVDAISDPESSMRLVVLVRPADGILIRRLASSRVSGCLYNDDEHIDVLGTVVRDVYAGRVRYSTEIYERIFIHVDASLTERELDVFNLLGQGLSNQAIAERLCISPYTVQNHISNIYGKLAVPQEGVSRRVWASNIGKDSGFIFSCTPVVIG
jgi:DNA-binding NarL/FixJ family response regulator